MDRIKDLTNIKSQKTHLTRLKYRSLGRHLVFIRLSSAFESHWHDCNSNSGRLR